MPTASKEEINRCGELLRDFMHGYPERSMPRDWSGINHALDVLGEFRASFQYPLTKVTVGLRQMVQRESGSVVVAQRLKRMDRIIFKLHRMPKTKAARLEDIGGCRAVLATPSEVNGVLRRIKKNWDVVREPRDYVAKPKSSGYRAIHVIVARDDRRIEVQLRTRGQQQWADTVERFASLWDLPLKDEQGPEEVLEFFRVAAEGIYATEYRSTQELDRLMARWDQASDAVRDWLARH